MRWRIPVVAALALFVAVSCQEAPGEPEATPDTPLFSAEVVHYSGGFTDEFDFLIPCGGVNEWGHFIIEGKWRASETYDANGGYHFRNTLVTNGSGVGEFGSVWTIHEAIPTASYLPPDAGDYRVYNDHVTSMWVGKGHAPSWNDWVNYKWTMNANGEVTVDRFSNRTECN